MLVRSCRKGIGTISGDCRDLWKRNRDNFRGLSGPGKKELGQFQGTVGTWEKGTKTISGDCRDLGKRNRDNFRGLSGPVKKERGQFQKIVGTWEKGTGTIPGDCQELAKNKREKFRGLSVAGARVPRRSVHLQNDNATIQPTLSVHPTNCLLWQFAPVTFFSYTYTIRPGIFHPPRLQGGRFVTRNMLSTPYYLSCDIMSTLSWTFCHRIFLTRWVCVRESTYP